MRFVLPDTSVWGRFEQPDVARVLVEALQGDRVVVTAPVVLELLRGARDRRDLAQRARKYDALPKVDLGPSIETRAREVQAALSWHGYHRGPSAADLLTAAAAESVGAELWHCDRHFELIAGVTGQPVRRLGQ